MKKSTLTLEDCLAVVKGYGLGNIGYDRTDGVLISFSFSDSSLRHYIVGYKLFQTTGIYIESETELSELKDINDLKEHLDSIIESTK